MSAEADFLCRACDVRVPLLADLRRHVSSLHDAEHVQLARALSLLDQHVDKRSQRVAKGKNRPRAPRSKSASTAASAESPSPIAVSASADAPDAKPAPQKHPRHHGRNQPLRPTEDSNKGKKEKERHSASLRQELKEKNALRPLSQVQLNAALQKITEWVEAHFVARKPDSERLQQREDLLDRLREIVSQDSMLSRFNLQLFGSVPSSLDSRHSDLDICLVGNTGDPASVLEILSKVFRRHKLGKILVVLSARVPVVKLTHKETGIECDFTVASEFRHHHLKSCLLQAYASLDERFSQLVDAVKYWSKQRYIGDASKGSLNSFGHTLLVLHYCQTCSPPLLPNLQNGQEISHEDSLYQLNPFTSSSMYHDFKRENMQSIGEHLLGFFTLFSTKFHYRQQYISVRDTSMKELPSVKERQKMFHERQRSMFVIIDPFDDKDNVGRNLTRRVADAIQSEFRRAHTLLLHGCSWDDLTELVEEPQPSGSHRARQLNRKDGPKLSNRGDAEAVDGRPPRRRVFRPTRKQRQPRKSGNANAAAEKDQQTQRQRPPEISATV